jgi:hypothetical protein
MPRPNFVWRRPKRGRKVFFIGFNKCGTKSLHELFEGSGYRSLHGRRKLLTGRKINLAQQFARNIASGSPILAGIAGGDVFSDLTSVSDTAVIEACLMFRQLHQQYPDAYFVLNTRPMEHWIQSRLNHGNSTVGSFTQRYMRATGDTHEQVIERWRNLFLQHHEDVRTYFKDKGRFLEFPIYGDVSALIEFVREDYSLRESKWRHLGKTTEREARRKRAIVQN